MVVNSQSLPSGQKPRFQKLHYRSNLKSASNDLQFDVHLIHRILRLMVKKQLWTLTTMKSAILVSLPLLAALGGSDAQVRSKPLDTEHMTLKACNLKPFVAGRCDASFETWSFQVEWGAPVYRCFVLLAGLGNHQTSPNALIRRMCHRRQF